jgi:ABC-type antimicrobial peptide transport system permease subunit
LTDKVNGRIDLGATATKVIGRILREALWLAGFGIIVGSTAALWLARFIGAMLSAWDRRPARHGRDRIVADLRVIAAGICSSSPGGAHRSYSCAAA